MELVSNALVLPCRVQTVRASIPLQLLIEIRLILYIPNPTHRKWQPCKLSQICLFLGVWLLLGTEEVKTL